jgi:hypothetical protein
MNRRRIKGKRTRFAGDGLLAHYEIVTR